jgi:hypothetical protein
VSGYTYLGAGGSGYTSALAGGNMSPAVPAVTGHPGALMMLVTGANSTTLGAPNLTAQGWTKITGNATAKCEAAYIKYAVGDGSDAGPTFQWDASHQAAARIYAWVGDVYTDPATIVVAFNERATNTTGQVAVNATGTSGIPANSLYIRFGHCLKTSLNNSASFLDWATNSGIFTKAGEYAQNGTAMAGGLWYASLAAATATSADVAALPTTDTNANTQGITLILQPSVPGAVLAGTPAASASASGTLTNPGAISGSATTSASAAVQLTTAIRAAAAANAGTSLAAGLTNWTIVTLTGTQYTGPGGIHDTNFWSGGDPPVGTTLSYDATNATIYANAEISSITNNCSFVVQWFDPSAGVERIGVVIITPQMVSYASIGAAAAATLSTAIKLSGGAIAIASSSGDISTAIRLAGTALAIANAGASLVTAIQLGASGISSTAATGALSGGQSSLQGNAQVLSTLLAALTSKIQLASAVSATSVLAGALSSQVIFSGAANALTNALADITTGIRLAGNAVVASSAAGAALITTTFAGAANAVSSAAGAIQTGIRFAGQALADSQGAGALSTGISLAGAAEADTVAAIRPTGSEGQFGYADINLLSPTGLPVTLAVYLEGSTFISTITYFNSKGLPFVPSRVQYRIDDINSGITLLPYTDITDVELSNAITIPGSDNTMISNSRVSEQHQLLFKITDGLGLVSYARAVFEVVATTGVN